MDPLRIVTCAPARAPNWPASLFDERQLWQAWWDGVERIRARGRQSGISDPNHPLEIVVAVYSAATSEVTEGLEGSEGSEGSDQTGASLKAVTSKLPEGCSELEKYLASRGVSELRWIPFSPSDRVREVDSWWRFLGLLRNELEFESEAFGKDGNLQGTQEGAIWVDISFAEPRMARAVTLAVAEREIRRAATTGDDRRRFPALAFVGFGDFDDEDLDQPEFEEVDLLAVPLVLRANGLRFARSLDTSGLADVLPARPAGDPAVWQSLEALLKTSHQLARALRMLRVHHVAKLQGEWQSAYAEFQGAAGPEHELVAALADVASRVRTLAPQSPHQRISNEDHPGGGTDEWDGLDVAFSLLPVLVDVGHHTLALMLAREVYVELGFALIASAAVTPLPPPEKRLDSWVTHHVQRITVGVENEADEVREELIRYSELWRDVLKGPRTELFNEIKHVRNAVVHLNPRRRRNDAEEVRNDTDSLINYIERLIPRQDSESSRGEAKDEAWIDNAIRFRDTVRNLTPPPRRSPEYIKVIAAVEGATGDAGATDQIIANHIWAVAPDHVRRRMDTAPLVVRIDPTTSLEREVLRPHPDVACIVIDSSLETAVVAAAKLGFAGVDIYYFDRGRVDTSGRGAYELTGGWRALSLSEWGRGESSKANKNANSDEAADLQPR